MPRFEITQTEVLNPTQPISVFTKIKDAIADFFTIVTAIFVLFFIGLYAVIEEAFYLKPKELHQKYKSNKSPANENIVIDDDILEEEEDENKTVLYESHTFKVEIQMLDYDLPMIHTNPPLKDVSGEFIESAYHIFNHIILFAIPEGEEYVDPTKVIALDCITQNIRILAKDDYFSSILFEEIDTQNLKITCKNDAKTVDFIVKMSI